MADAIATRAAEPRDYLEFVRLFTELGVEDPVPSEERWASTQLPFTRVAEEGDRVVGYVFSKLLIDACYVFNLVTEPGRRRRGIGHALMQAVRSEAVAADKTRWDLNVKADNTAAIALYERLGFVARHATTVLRAPWATLIARAADEDSFDPKTIRVELVSLDEAPALERHYDMPSGILTLRATGSLERRPRAESDGLLARARDAATGDVLGIALFAPQFPGVHPLRARSAAVARALLRALEQHRVPITDPAKPWRAVEVQLAVEASPAVADALVASGAIVVHEILYFTGPLRETNP
ncbi:MAG: GNAT family N-acetyltransferase [Polyangiaceae bacterium]